MIRRLSISAIPAGMATVIMAHLFRPGQMPFEVFIVIVSGAVITGAFAVWAVWCSRD